MRAWACRLYILVEAVLRVGGTVAIRAEDIDFSKTYLHIQSTNVKLKKAHTFGPAEVPGRPI